MARLRSSSKESTVSKESVMSYDEMERAGALKALVVFAVFVLALGVACLSFSLYFMVRAEWVKTEEALSLHLIVTGVAFPL